MVKSKHVTFGGLGQHEFYLPRTGRGHENRRDRRKCDYYNTSDQYCNKIKNKCVGPTVCMKYSTAKTTHKKESWWPQVGATVYNSQNREGKIVTISGDICTIQYLSGKKISAKYPDVFQKGVFKMKRGK